tara:strand:+ start:225 stop:896 length:672 start_codon:yes stop_codon:yes gene_type:complete
MIKTTKPISERIRLLIIVTLFQSGSAAVIYDPAGGTLFGAQGTPERPYASKEFDIDGDGQTDLEFVASTRNFFFAIKGPSTTSVVTNTGLINTTGSPLALDSGFEVSGLLNSLEDAYFHPLQLHPLLFTTTFNGGIGETQEGGWVGLDAYMGFSFLIGENEHFGYIRIEPLEFMPGAFFYESAYESEPGRPIFAGAVPEPSTTIFVILSAAGLCITKRKRASW